MATKGKLEIPVSAVFEKRLAELVWQNCPKLARETAAGQLALRLDFDAGSIQKVVIEQLIAEMIAKFRPKLKKTIDSAITKAVKDHATHQIENTEWIESNIHRRIDQLCEVVMEEMVRSKCSQLLDTRVDGDSRGMIAVKAEELVNAHIERELQDSQEVVT
jgi:hypothetical protein